MAFVKEPLTDDFSRITGGISINTDTALYQKVNDVYQSVLASATTSATFSLAFTFQPVTAAANTAFAKNGGNSLNIAAVSQSCKSLRILNPILHLLTN